MSENQKVNLENQEQKGDDSITIFSSEENRVSLGWLAGGSVYSDICQFGSRDSTNVFVGCYDLNKLQKDITRLFEQFEHQQAILLDLGTLKPYQQYCGDLLCARFRLYMWDFFHIELIRLCFSYLNDTHPTQCTYCGKKQICKS